ncbi:MAG TPA: peptidyl-prolyl cis-trans isomerase, partial [Ignavibacteria bacterium]|nr:peptidyl-prolyl cis-trans isomerase [Ignavibacteria bacterium]
KDDEIQQYYEQNKSKYTYSDTSGVKVRSYDEVKMQAANDLQQQRAKDLDKAYIERLRQKYPVKVHDAILEKTFKNI